MKTRAGSGKTLTVEDALQFKVVSDAQIKRDGSLIAYVVSDAFASSAALPHSEIWLVAPDGSNNRRLTSSSANGLAPRWSGDGRQLLYLGDRDRNGELTLNLWTERDGTRPIGVSTARLGESVEHRVEVSGGIGAAMWSADSTQIAYLMTDAVETASSAMDVVRPEADVPKTRLWTVDLASSQSRPVSLPDVQVWDFDWADSGHFAIIASNDASESSWYQSWVAILDPRTSELTTAYMPPALQVALKSESAYPPLSKQLAKPFWIPGTRLLTFVACAWSDRAIVGGDVYLLDTDHLDQAPVNLTAESQVSVSWTAWHAQREALLVAGWFEGEQCLAYVSIDKREVQIIWRGEAAFSDRYQPRFTRSDAGTIAAVREDHSHPREVFIATPGDSAVEWSRLTSLQPSLDPFDLADLRTLRWTSKDNVQVQGHLLLPPSFHDGDKAPPLVVWPHGGPSFLHQYLFHGWVEGPYAMPFECLTAAGIAVLLPNPRGSLGWGAEFTEKLLQQTEAVDLEDILAGVDLCVDRGFADESRIGIGGWSWGGYLAPLAAGTTNRFRAVFMGAGIADWRIFRASESPQRTLDALFFAGDPYVEGSASQRLSPLTHVSRVTAPVLVIHCDGDPILSPSQAYAFYRGIQDQGGSAELVIYPNEGHAVRQRDHIVDISNRVVEFFRKHLVEAQ